MEANRTTAGIPGLSPQARSRTDRFWRNRETLQNTYQDSETKKKAAAGSKEDRTPEAKKGIDLPGWLFMARLKRLNSNFFFERSYAVPQNMGIYYIHPIRGKSFICAFPAEHVSEFDTKNVDDEGNPRMPLPGWRTVLVKLMKGGFITEGQALALFGPPSRTSKNWALFMGHRQAEVTDAL